MKTSIDLFAQLELPGRCRNVREEMGRTYRAQGQTGEAAAIQKALAILRDTRLTYLDSLHRDSTERYTR